MYIVKTCVISLLFVGISLADVPTEVAKPGVGPLLSSEFIYPLEGRQTPQCHASTIEATPTGLVAAWFGGKHEKNPDVGIWVSRHEKGGWSKPVEVVNGVQSEDKRYPCWNPVLFQPEKGDLLLFYKVGPSPSLWWGMLTTSADGGKTWTEPVKLGVNRELGKGNPNLLGPVKNKPIQLADGSLLCPTSSEHNNWRVHFEKYTQDDSGKWKCDQVIGPIHNGEKFNAIQPSILNHGDGKLQALCRSRESVIVETWSQDNGATWSKPAATTLPNPNAGTDAVTLADGRHLLVYNHTTRGGDFPSGRNMLNVAISSDGKNWKTILTLEREKRSEFSYPAVIQSADGLVHIVYTWKRQTVKHAVLKL